MRVTLNKPFEVHPGRVLKVIKDEIIDIDDPIAINGIMSGHCSPVDKEDIDNFKYLETKKLTKNKEKVK